MYFFINGIVESNFKVWILYIYINVFIYIVYFTLLKNMISKL